MKPDSFRQKDRLTVTGIKVIVIAKGRRQSRVGVRPAMEERKAHGNQRNAANPILMAQSGISLRASTQRFKPDRSAPSISAC